MIFQIIAQKLNFIFDLNFYLIHHTLSLPKTICLLGCSLNAVRDDSKNENFQPTSVILGQMKKADDEN